MNPTREGRGGAEKSAVRAFVQEKLRVVSGMTSTAFGEAPTTALRVQKAFVEFAAAQGAAITLAQAKELLDERLVYVPAATKVAGTSVKGLYKRAAGSQGWGSRWKVSRRTRSCTK